VVRLDDVRVHAVGVQVVPDCHAVGVTVSHHVVGVLESRVRRAGGKTPDVLCEATSSAAGGIVGAKV
jgi:hypothetical protein